MGEGQQSAGEERDLVRGARPRRAFRWRIAGGLPTGCAAVPTGPEPEYRGYRPRPLLRDFAVPGEARTPRGVRGAGEDVCRGLWQDFETCQLGRVRELLR